MFEISVWQYLQTAFSRADINPVQFSILAEICFKAVEERAPIRLPGRHSRKVPTRTFRRHVHTIPKDLLTCERRRGCKGNVYRPSFLDHLENGANCAEPPPGMVPESPPEVQEWHHSPEVSESPQVPQGEPVTAECRDNGTIPAAVDIDIVEVSNKVDRLLNEHKPGKADLDLLKSGMQDFMQMHGKIRQAPDDDIVRQFAAVANVAVLVNLLQDLNRERRHHPRGYAWFVTVALDRFHKIPYEKFRLQWRHLNRKPPQAAAGVSGTAFRDDILSQLRL